MNPQMLAAVNARIEKMSRGSGDIFAPVRQAMLAGSQQEVRKSPESPSANLKGQGGRLGAFTGGIAGAALGAYTIGVTTELGGILTVSLMLIGGVVGCFGGAKAGSKIERDK